jgi:hypothetical protein
VEDHDLTFGNFEGVLREAEYGAGCVRIGDRRTYDWQQWTDQRIVSPVTSTDYSLSDWALAAW